jgi:hypothetical protein
MAYNAPKRASGSSEPIDEQKIACLDDLIYLIAARAA